MLSIHLVLLFGIMGAFWRAWFGGSFGNTKYKWFNNLSRIWKIFVLLIIYIIIFYLKGVMA